MSVRTPDRQNRQRKVDFILITFSAGSFVLFLSSLSQDGFRTEKGAISAVALLLIGWVAVFDGVWAWMANPALLATWILMFLKLRLPAFVVSVVSLGLSLSFLSVSQILTDEAGNYSPITGCGSGYWLWLASIVAAVVGCLASLALSLRDRGNANSLDDARATTVSGARIVRD